MPKTERPARPGAGRLVAPSRDPHVLARVVPHLSSEVLHHLVRHRGLEDAADLVTSATPAQLTSLLDLDLWRAPRAGQNESFDVSRFGEWLEMLADLPPAVAARTLAAMDVSVVVAGLSRFIRVF